MIKQFLFSISLTTLFLQACSASQSLPVEQAIPTESVAPLESLAPAAVPIQETVVAPITEASPVAEADAVDCLGGETSPIAESVAEEYEFANYAEVVTWFCNGAEFEDILVALETEAQTGTPAEEMLQMLADGFSWEDIWQFVGLTE